ncbi:MAG: RsmE family RNA methyltransferase [Verrucomicrobiota bacterium]
MHRFYCREFESGVLSEEESRHARQVLRLEEGSSACVFDGKGREARVKLFSKDKKNLRFETVSISQTLPSPCRIHLAQGLPKGKSMDIIVQKATELGVASIQPLLSERSVVHLEKTDAKKEKWMQTAIESCKQCGQNWLPVFYDPVTPKEFLQCIAMGKNYSLQLIGSLQSEAQSLHTLLQKAKREKNMQDVICMVGPEGDFTPSEIGQARAEGFLPVSLGPHVLRSETAAIFLMSVLLYETALA